MILNDKQKHFVTLCNKEFGEIKEITRKQLIDVEKKYKVAFPQWLVSVSYTHLTLPTIYSV